MYSLFEAFARYCGLTKSSDKTFNTSHLSLLKSYVQHYASLRSNLVGSQDQLTLYDVRRQHKSFVSVKSPFSNKGVFGIKTQLTDYGLYHFFPEMLYLAKMVRSCIALNYSYPLYIYKHSRMRYLFEQDLLRSQYLRQGHPECSGYPERIPMKPSTVREIVPIYQNLMPMDMFDISGAERLCKFANVPRETLIKPYDSIVYGYEQSDQFCTRVHKYIEKPSTEYVNMAKARRMMLYDVWREPFRKSVDTSVAFAIQSKSHSPLSKNV